MQSYFNALQNNGLDVIANSKIREAFASQEKNIYHISRVLARLV